MHLISEWIIICTPITPRNTIHFSVPMQVKTQQFLPVSASEACVSPPVCTNPRAAINCSCQDFQLENSGQVIKKVKLFPTESKGNFQLALSAQVLNFSFATLIITTQLQWPSVLKLKHCIQENFPSTGITHTNVNLSNYSNYHHLLNMNVTTN